MSAQQIREALPSLAVFVDVENFAGYCAAMETPVDLAPELTALSRLGRIVVRRSIGDISALPQPAFNPRKVRQMLQQNHVQHEDVPHLSYFKNSADIRLVVEAMHLALSNPEISHFAIIANDRDFVPLFLKLQSLGKVVIGCGPSSERVNAYYRSACDLFLYHDELAGSQRKSETLPAEVPARVADEAEQLQGVIRTLQAEEGVARAPRVGQRMRSINAAFDPKSSDGSFKRFCERMAAKGKVVLSRCDAPDFLLSLPDEMIAPRALATESEAGTGSPSGMSGAYHEWCRNKLRISIPAPVQRQAVFGAATRILSARESELPIPLKTLAHEIGQQIPGVEATAFRLLYGLFRCRALACILTEDAFNPAVAAIAVPFDQLDACFVANTLSVFLRDDRGLSFDADAWAQVFYQDESAAGLIRELVSWAMVAPTISATPEATIASPCAHSIH